MANNQSLWYLENIDVTNVFCPTKMSHAQSSQVHRTFKKGEYIYLPEEHADKIYFINEGQVKIGAYGDSGKEITKAILSTGEVFGELAIIGEDKRRDFAIALDSTDCCIVTREEMTALMRERSDLMVYMMKMIGSRKLEIERRLESLVFKDSRTRIVEFLKHLAERKGQRVGYEIVVRRFMTHQEIANLTATSRQTVTTVLNELRSKNILTFNRRRLLIRDMDLLGKEAT